jgi:hypothetical protein
MLPGYFNPPPVPQGPTSVTFTAPCPCCGEDVEWRQRFSSTAIPSDFTINCRWERSLT